MSHLRRLLPFLFLALSSALAWAQDVAPATLIPQVAAQADVDASAFNSEARLFRVELPAGVIQGWDVMFNGDHRTRYTLPVGYDGFQFVGKGVGQTIVKDDFQPWHDSAIFIGPFNGPVVLQGMTIVGSRSKAVHAGLATKTRTQVTNPVTGAVTYDYVVSRPVLPNFNVQVIDCYIYDDPADGRSKWGLFGYQVDWLVQHSRLDWKEGVEHASYEHGYAKVGSLWIDVEVESSGAEGSKVRNDNQEIQWVKGARIVRRDVKVRDWYQPWSWRGGAGMVFQGTGCDILLERCEYWGGPNSKMRCLMIDDGGVRVDGKLDYYSASDGTPGGAFANGFVMIRQCAFSSGPGPDWYGTIMRIGNFRAGHKVARGVWIESCGVYGTKMLAQLTDSPLSITGCNTEAIRDYCNALGMDVGAEAMISGNPLVPFSRGKSSVAAAEVGVK